MKVVDHPYKYMMNESWRSTCGSALLFTLRQKSFTPRPQCLNVLTMIPTHVMIMCTYRSRGFFFQKDSRYDTLLGQSIRDKCGFFSGPVFESGMNKVPQSAIRITLTGMCQVPVQVPVPGILCVMQVRRVRCYEPIHVPHKMTALRSMIFGSWP